MTSNLEPQKGKDTGLNATIDALNLAKATSSITPAKASFGSVSTLLTTIKVPLPIYAMDFQFTYIQFSTTNEQDYLDLALFCADVCKALEQGLDGRRLDEVSRSVLGAIERLTA